MPCRYVLVHAVYKGSVQVEDQAQLTHSSPAGIGIVFIAYLLRPALTLRGSSSVSLSVPPSLSLSVSVPPSASSDASAFSPSSSIPSDSQASFACWLRVSASSVSFLSVSFSSDSVCSSMDLLSLSPSKPAQVLTHPYPAIS